MKRVIKRDSPQNFESWKSNGKRRRWSCFKKYTGLKNSVKRQLLEEQGYICCYCGKRIECDEKTVIEHFKPKSVYPNLQLDYQNLFVSCDGGEGKRCEQGKLNIPKAFPLSCDAKKGVTELPFGPLSPDYESLVRYNIDGSVTDMTNNGDGEIMIQTLGIDNPNLVNNRKKAIKPWINELLSADKLKEIINYYETKHNGKYEEYCYVIKQVLEDLS